MCKNLIYENTPSKQSTFDIYIYIYMFHDKQARDEKKRIYGYMVLTIIYMNTNFPDSVPVNEKKNTLIALSLYVLLYIIFKIKIKFQQSSIAGK